MTDAGDEGHSTPNSRSFHAQQSTDQSTPESEETPGWSGPLRDDVGWDQGRSVQHDISRLWTELLGHIKSCYGQFKWLVGIMLVVATGVVGFGMRTAGDVSAIQRDIFNLQETMRQDRADRSAWQTMQRSYDTDLRKMIDEQQKILYSNRGDHPNAIRQ